MFEWIKIYDPNHELRDWAMLVNEVKRLSARTLGSDETSTGMGSTRSRFRGRAGITRSRCSPT